MYLKKQNLNEDVPTNCIFKQPKPGWNRYWYDLKKTIWVKFRNFWWGRDWRNKARNKRPVTKSGLAIYESIVDENKNRASNRCLNLIPTIRKNLNDSTPRHN